MTRGHSRLLHQDKNGCTHARRHGFKLNANTLSTCNGETLQSNLIMQMAVNAHRAACVSGHQPVIFASHHTFLLFPLSHAVGPHHGVGAKDETKHDSVWQPLSGSALIHSNPAVGGELRERDRERDEAERETQTGRTQKK